jgi:hypothetical protein
MYLNSAGSRAPTEELFTSGRRSMGVWKFRKLKPLKELEAKNHKLKQMYAELALDNKILKEVLGKGFRPC